MLIRVFSRLVVPLMLALPLSAPALPAARLAAYHPALANLGPGATYRWHAGDGGVHVVTITRGRLNQLRVVLAHDRVRGGRETVAAMCRLHHCLAAVNGDFFGPHDHPGGIVLDRRVLRSPNRQHEQLLVHPAGPHHGTRLGWDATLTVGSHHVRMPVNVIEHPPAITLFTSRFTGAPPAFVGSVALWLKRTDPHQPLDVLGSHVPVVAVAFRPLATVGRVPPGWAVVVGRGTGARRLHDLYRQIQLGGLPRRVSLDWDPVQQVRESLGAHPVMMRHGHGVLDPRDPWNRTRHQRTIVAGGPDGRVWLIVTDSPITNYNAVRLLRHWHAVWAVGLDGGGSSTMVVRGHTVNHLQDGAPRKVASALVFVPARDVRRAPSHAAVHHRPPARARHTTPPAVATRSARPAPSATAATAATAAPDRTPLLPPSRPVTAAAPSRSATDADLAALLAAGLALGLWLASRIRSRTLTSAHTPRSRHVGRPQRQ